MIDYCHLPKTPVTDPTMTAASLSQFPVEIPLPLTAEPAGNCEPRRTQSRIASLTRSLLLLNVRAETPPRTTISCSLDESEDARERQKYEGRDEVSRATSNGWSKFGGAAGGFSSSSSAFGLGFGIACEVLASKGCNGGEMDSKSASKATMF